MTAYFVLGAVAVSLLAIASRYSHLFPTSLDLNKMDGVNKSDTVVFKQICMLGGKRAARTRCVLCRVINTVHTHRFNHSRRVGRRWHGCSNGQRVPTQVVSYTPSASLTS